MGYDITIIKPTELDERFKPQYQHYDTEEAIRDQLLDMKYTIIHDIMSTSNKGGELVYTKGLRFKLKMYIDLLKEQARRHIFDTLEENGEIHLCGWHLTHRDGFDIDDYMDLTLETLIKYKYLIPTPDYFENSEHFNEKLEMIKEALDFEDSIYDELHRDFVQTYQDEYEKKYDENDIEEIQEPDSDA